MIVSRYAPDTNTGRVNWSMSALCKRPNVDPAWWHSDKPADRKEARDWCVHCPVKDECLDEALEVEGDTPASRRFGIFAGLDGRERYDLHTTGKLPQKVTRNGRPPAQCGTEASYQRHLKLGEPIDEECRQAHNAHSAKYRRRTRR